MAKSAQVASIAFHTKTRKLAEKAKNLPKAQGEETKLIDYSQIVDYVPNLNARSNFQPGTVFSERKSKKSI